MYVLQGEEIVEKEITYTPGLYKIYDEIVVNAADNKQRDPSMDKLEIEISSEKNTISVKNNGKGIPIEFHKDEKLYVPTLVFGKYESEIVFIIAMQHKNIIFTNYSCNLLSSLKDICSLDLTSMIMKRKLQVAEMDSEPSLQTFSARNSLLSVLIPILVCLSNKYSAKT